jgi:DNA gyrase/topoisomerase IV subunit A
MGYIKRLVLPLIIVKITNVKTKGKQKKGDIIDFQSEMLFDEWNEKNNKRYDYTIDYVKGLGGYDSETIERFFDPDNYHKLIYTYKIEDAVEAKSTFDLFFNSKKAKLRKELLRTPVKFLPKEEMQFYNKQKIINVEKVHFGIDNKIYSLELISRQLVNLIDGLNEVRRKIVYAALKQFGHNNKKLKTYVFGGITASTSLYEHGDGSLTNSLSLMCQHFPTAHMYPFLEGTGSFGSRHDSEYASPRYTQCSLSKITKLIFNPLDNYVLDYKLSENKRIEPVNYVPIFPVAILENYNNVSFGYKSLSYRRDLKVIRDIILDRINGTNDLAYDEIPICKKYNKGKIEIINNVEYSYGAYELKKSKPKLEQYDIINITELPIAVESDSYRLDLINHKVKGEFIERINRNNTKTEVNMDVILKKDSYQKIIDKFGDIITFLGLKKSLHANLSYYHDTDGFGHVVVCNKYIEVIDYWYEARKNTYAKRIDRELIISNLRIIRLENIIRYVEFSKENKIQELESDEIATEFLLTNKFVLIDDNLLSNPEFTPIKEVEELVLRGPKSNMDYLLSLQQRQLTINSLNKYIKKLEEEKLNNIELTGYLSESPPGKTIWIKEMEAAYKAMTT